MVAIILFACGIFAQRDELNLEKELLLAAKSSDWSQHAQTTNLGEGSISSLFNLSPGRWIIYKNQRNLITQCYCIIVTPDTKNELIADKICYSPRVKLIFGDAN